MIKHTATLAQLNFDDAEIAALVPRFQAFLGFVDKMREVPDGSKCVGVYGLNSYIQRPTRAQ